MSQKKPKQRKPEQKTPRLKPGWKRDLDGTEVSPDVWKERYCIRAVTFVVASPAEFGKGSTDAWKKLRDDLKTAWVRSTEAANWAFRYLLTHDVQRECGSTKCPKAPKINLYKARGPQAWAGWAASAAAVLQTVSRNYYSKRYEIMWTGGQSLPCVRYPYPFPVRGADWTLYENPDGGLYFEARLPDCRTSVRLSGGPQFRLQLTQARWLIQNPHLRAEAAIYRRKDKETKKYKIFVKLVGWFPRQKQADAAGIMFVNTTPESFLVGMNARDEQLWVINGDRARRWAARTAAATQRYREDLKYEIRRPQRKRRKFAEDMQRATLKNRNRLASFVDESAAQIVNHAKRRHLAKIIFNDTCRTYFKNFQWYQLAVLLEQKCNAAGIAFERIAGHDDTDAEVEDGS